MRGSTEDEHADKLVSAIECLIQTLASRDGMSRQAARRSLVAIGEPATDGLVEALTHKSAQLRWEAAKALSELADPKGGPALVAALADREFGVRWLAAEGLIVLGRAGLAPLMQALVDKSSSTLLLEGAHHVLRVLAERGLRDLVAPILQALEGPEPAIDVIPEATALLGILQDANGATPPNRQL
jgi:HEAT repeat protein